MTDLNVTTLGGIAFVRDGDEFRPPTRKAAALLVYLALSPRGSRSREHLADALWGRSADEQSRASLRQTLSILRKTLGERADLLQPGPDAVGIDRARIEIDALEFETLARSPGQADLERAAEIYQGPFLEGFSLKEEGFEEWLAFTREQYRELALQLFVRLVEHYRMLREYETSLRYALRLLALDPLREQTHRLLMELFARLGRREQALLQYGECVRLLEADLGIEPAAETQALYASIKAGIAPGDDADADDRPDAARQAEDSSAAPVSRTEAGRPVIVVLPFDNLSGDPAQDYFSAGITEDIITELSRFRSLSVIAHSSSMSLKQQGVDLPDMVGRLGAGYVLEGSVRRSSDKVRVTAQLIAAASGEHVWANRYDREIVDIFQLQDEVTRMIVATVGGRLEDHGTSFRDLGCCDWSIYDLILRAQALHYRILKPSNEEARAILASVRERDPDNARVHSLLGAVLLLDYTMSWAGSPDETLELALQHGRKAIRLDPLDSLAHARLGETLIHFHKFGESKRHFDKALELNPNDSAARALSSLYWVATGDTGRALQELETVRRIDPYERIWIPWFRGEALFMAGRYAEAIDSLEEVTEPINDLRLTLSACYVHCDDLETARQLLRLYLIEAKGEMPNFPGPDLDDWIDYARAAAGYQDDKHHRLLIEALRRIWPEPADFAALLRDVDGVPAENS
jgi:TolB-like protein